MCNIQNPHRTNRTYKKYHIKPAVVKVKMNISQNFSDNYTIIRRQVHPHQKYTRHKIHSHNLCEEEDEEIAGFSAGDSVEPLDQVDEESSDRTHDNDTDNDKT